MPSVVLRVARLSSCLCCESLRRQVRQAGGSNYPYSGHNMEHGNCAGGDSCAATRLRPERRAIGHPAEAARHRHSRGMPLTMLQIGRGCWHAREDTKLPLEAWASCAGLEVVGGGREEQAFGRSPPSAACSGAGAAVLCSHSMRMQALASWCLCCSEVSRK